jgi:transcriptional regulator with XRE-family HTH domain
LTSLYVKGTISKMAPVMDTFYEGLGRRIQSLRKQRGLTQEQLGARLTPQVTRASIANIEAGKQRVLAHTVAQLAGALEVTADDLLRERGAAPDETLKDAVEAKLQGRVSPDQLSQLKRKLGLDDGGTHDANSNTYSAGAAQRRGPR